eukprot:12331013-Alexandrium_andersonii.AAC.1
MEALRWEAAWQRRAVPRPSASQQWRRAATAMLRHESHVAGTPHEVEPRALEGRACLLYTSDAADDM